MKHTQSRYSFLTYTVITALIAFIIKIPAGMLGSMVADIAQLTNPLYSASMQEPVLTRVDITTAVLIAPIIETILGQMLPIELLRTRTTKKSILIGTSAFLFMIMHYPVLEFFPSAGAVGIVFAYAWVQQREISVRTAFWGVTLSHALHNAIVAAMSAYIHTP